MRRIVRIELRRGVGIWALVPMIVALALAALAHPREWAGEWAGWSYELRMILIVLGPLVVAAAAWQGNREHRRGLEELLAATPRPPMHRTLASLASPAGGALAAFGLVAAGMAGVTATHTSYGHPLLGIALSAAAAVLLFAAVGYTVGRLSPWRVTAPIVALAAYVGIGILSYLDGGIGYLSPGVQLFGGELPAPWWPVASTVLFLATAVAVLLVSAARRRWIAAPVLGLAVLAAVPLAEAGDSAFTPDWAGQQLVCRSGAPQVCLTRRHADQLPVVSAQIRADLAGLDVPGPIVEQRVGSGVDNESDTLNTLYLGATITGGADLDVVRDDAAQAAVHWTCAGVDGASPGERLRGATIAITEWIAHRPAPPTPESLLAGRTTAQVVSTSREFIAAAATCNRAAARRALDRRR